MRGRYSGTPLCRLGCGTLLTSHWGQHVWRLPLSARSAAAEALEAAQGVRCTVEDVHPVPRAFLEVGPSTCAAACALSLIGCYPSAFLGKYTWRLALLAQCAACCICIGRD